MDKVSFTPRRISVLFEEKRFTDVKCFRGLKTIRSDTVYSAETYRECVINNSSDDRLGDIEGSACSSCNISS